MDGGGTLGYLGEIALVITALTGLLNAVSSFRNGTKLDKQDKKMDGQTAVLADVHRATNGELVPKVAEAVKAAKVEIAEAVVDAARTRYIKQD